jgi:hypothetical protein
MISMPFLSSQTVAPQLSEVVGQECDFFFAIGLAHLAQDSILRDRRYL